MTTERIAFTDLLRNRQLSEQANALGIPAAFIAPVRGETLAQTNARLEAQIVLTSQVPQQANPGPLAGALEAVIAPNAVQRAFQPLLPESVVRALPGPVRPLASAARQLTSPGRRSLGIANAQHHVPQVLYFHGSRY